MLLLLNEHTAKTYFVSAGLLVVLIFFSSKGADIALPYLERVNRRDCPEAELLTACRETQVACDT